MAKKVYVFEHYTEAYTANVGGKPKRVNYERGIDICEVQEDESLVGLGTVCADDNHKMVTVGPRDAKTLNAIMQAFGAPYLTIFSALWEYDAESADEAALAQVERLAQLPQYENDPQWAPNIGQFEKIGEHGWLITWISRNGWVYRFGKIDQHLHDGSLYVDYMDVSPSYEDETVPTMPALINFLTNGTPIPLDMYGKYPYSDNPYFREQTKDAREERQRQHDARMKAMLERNERSRGRDKKKRL